MQGPERDVLHKALIEQAASARPHSGDHAANADVFGNDVLGNDRHLANCPALVLNADYTPLSYYPLSLWPWQTAIKAVFLERVDIVASYAREVHSPSWTMPIPSVIALRQYVKPSEHPAFTRFNLFLRDRFACQYCGSGKDLTFDQKLELEKAWQQRDPQSPLKTPYEALKASAQDYITLISAEYKKQIE